MSTENNIKSRIDKAWAAIDGLRRIWKSTIPDKLKRSFFRAVVESVPVYEYPVWTLTKRFRYMLDGVYTRMLRAVLNISCREHPSKQRIYENVSTFSTIIQKRRLRFDGHCWKSKEKLVINVLLWTPNHGATKVKKPRKRHLQQLA